MNSLNEFLLNHEINLDKKVCTVDAIISDKERLSRVAGYYNDGKDILIEVISARINALREYIEFEATPYEMLETRRAIVELTKLLDDFETYSIEDDRVRKKQGEASVGTNESLQENKTIQL